MLGVIVWSEAFPDQIMAAAEEAAGDRPYCIEVSGTAVNRRRDLTALSVLARDDHGFMWNFHALMVIGSAASRTYANWSFREHSFEPVSGRARIGLHLDEQRHCEPVERFVSQLD